jgi:hypothetical protein
MKLTVVPRETAFVNLREAYLCSDCEAIGNSANRCPRCQSDALIAVSRALPHHSDSIRIICAPASGGPIQVAPIDEPAINAA